MGCRPCRSSGVRKDGGSIGLCWDHIKRRCRDCGSSSNGNKECTKCAHDADISRWTALAEMRTFDQEQMAEIDEVRKEKLHRSRMLAHQGVEVLFQSLIGVVQAIYGAPPIEKQPFFHIFGSDVKTGK